MKTHGMVLMAATIVLVCTMAFSAAIAEENEKAELFERYAYALELYDPAGIEENVPE